MQSTHFKKLNKLNDFSNKLVVSLFYCFPIKFPLLSIGQYLAYWSTVYIPVYKGFRGRNGIKCS